MLQIFLVYALSCLPADFSYFSSILQTHHSTRNASSDARIHQQKPIFFPPHDKNFFPPITTRVFNSTLGETQQKHFLIPRSRSLILRLYVCAFDVRAPPATGRTLSSLVGIEQGYGYVVSTPFLTQQSKLITFEIK